MALAIKIMNLIPRTGKTMKITRSQLKGRILQRVRNKLNLPQLYLSVLRHLLTVLSLGVDFLYPWRVLKLPKQSHNPWVRRASRGKTCSTPPHRGQCSQCCPILCYNSLEKKSHALTKLYTIHVSSLFITKNIY